MGDARRDARKKKTKDGALKPADIMKKSYFDNPGSGYSTGEETIYTRRKKSAHANDTFTETKETKQSSATPPRTSDSALSVAVSVNNTGDRYIRTNYTPPVGVTDPGSLTRTAYVSPKSKQTDKRGAELKPSSASERLLHTHVVQTTKEHGLVTPTDILGSPTRNKTSQKENYKTKPSDKSCTKARPTSARDGVAAKSFVQTTKASVLPKPTEGLRPTPHNRTVIVGPKTRQTGKSCAEVKPTSAKDLMKWTLMQTKKDSEHAGTRPKVASRKPNSETFDPGLIIIIMNANGTGQSDPVERRQCIANTVKARKPKILLFQEFTWKGITGKIWEDSPLPTHYQYFGNKEASVLYDVRDIVAEELRSTDVRRILDHLQRTSNNAFNSPFPTDFDPLSRMCACSVSTIGVPFWEFICVSWHGPWNGMTLDRRKTYFQYLLEFLKNIMTRFKRPLLIGGDFNIDFPDIAAFIKHPFKKYDYTPSKRRQGAVKDYFITSIDMDLNKLRYVNIGNYESCLDHDPVTSCLSKVIV